MNGRPLEFLLLLFAGWVNRRQLAVIDYLKEENRILCEQMQGRRLQFTDDQRRRLAIRGKALGRRMLRDVTRLLTPDTILRWWAGASLSTLFRGSSVGEHGAGDHRQPDHGGRRALPRTHREILAALRRGARRPMAAAHSNVLQLDCPFLF
jgi:hypothetical protein